TVQPGGNAPRPLPSASSGGSAGAGESGEVAMRLSVKKLLNKASLAIIMKIIYMTHLGVTPTPPRAAGWAAGSRAPWCNDCFGRFRGFSPFRHEQRSVRRRSGSPALCAVGRTPAAPHAVRSGRAVAPAGARQAAARRFRVRPSAFDDLLGPARGGQDHPGAPDGGRFRCAV